jgi:hypothetical protein
MEKRPLENQEFVGVLPTFLVDEETVTYNARACLKNTLGTKMDNRISFIKSEL